MPGERNPMQRFDEGERVRVNITNREDPDYDYHRELGTVVKTVEDDVSSVTGDERDGILYFINLDEGEEICLRWRDLRPAE